MNFFSKLFKRKEVEQDPSSVNINSQQNETEDAEVQTDGDAADTTKVYHLIVLDESGSMDVVRSATISGCNETIQTIRTMQKANPDQEHFVSIYLFSSGRSRYMIKNLPVDKVREITDKDYRPNSCTPLFDALGRTLTEMMSIVKGKHTLGYVTIITDGYENASKEYSLDMVRGLIDELKDMDVIFSFIGANIDAADYAASMHISNAMQFKTNDMDMRQMWEKERMCKLRSSAKHRFARMYMSESLHKFSVDENSGNYYDEDVDDDRVAPESITSLEDNEVFVFGTDVKGTHSDGASAYAVAHFGALIGQAEGMQGQSYAIPTVGVSEKEMYGAIERFCQYAKDHPETIFLVSPIGCGGAGYSPYVIAPMFHDAVKLKNVKLPSIFWKFNNSVLY